MYESNRQNFIMLEDNWLRGQVIIPWLKELKEEDQDELALTKGDTHFLHDARFKQLLDNLWRSQYEKGVFRRHRIELARRSFELMQDAMVRNNSSSVR